MPFDYREMFYKEIISISQDEELYFHRRFKASLMILNAQKVEELRERIKELKEAYNMQEWPLMVLEKRAKSSAVLKLKGDYDIKFVPTFEILEKLNQIDDWLDSEIRILGTQIRFSNIPDLGRTARN